MRAGDPSHPSISSVQPLSPDPALLALLAEHCKCTLCYTIKQYRERMKR
jgi:hypothetical protein